MTTTLLKLATKEHINALEASKASVQSLEALQQTVEELSENMGQVSETVEIANGGTGATTAAQALTNLGASPVNHIHGEKISNIIELSYNNELIDSVNYDLRYAIDYIVDFGETNSSHVRLWSRDNSPYDSSMPDKAILLDFYIETDNSTTLIGNAYDSEAGCFVPCSVRNCSTESDIFWADGSNSYGNRPFMQSANSGVTHYIGCFRLLHDSNNGHLKLLFSCQSSTDDYTNMTRMKGCVIND